VAAFAGMVMIGRAGFTAGCGAEESRPHVCNFPAQLRAVNARLTEDDESKLDTARMQSALDKCKLAWRWSWYRARATMHFEWGWRCGPV
jgi:hypothetical protein